MNFYLKNIGIDMNLKPQGFYQEVSFRLGDSNYFLGANYIRSSVKTEQNKELNPIIDPFFEREFQLGALALIFQYDSRDSIFTPDEGLFAKFSLRRFDDAFGGDYDLWRNNLKVLYFQPIGKDVVMGARFEAESVKGDDVPFFLNPSLNMRGIAAMRYQGTTKALAELQMRWEFANRWNLVLFGGGGKVFGEQSGYKLGEGVVEEKVSFMDADFHEMYGTGFRYELARKFKLWGGLDFAQSQEEDFAFYITVGSAWSAFF